MGDREKECEKLGIVLLSCNVRFMHISWWPQLTAALDQYIFKAAVLKNKSWLKRRQSDSY